MVVVICLAALRVKQISVEEQVIRTEAHRDHKAMNRLEAFISQLDGLVVFLAAAYEEVFRTIQQHESAWFPESQNPTLPDTFDSYRVTISKAAFLLGYAYFETFLADLARDIYQCRPALLPQDKQITFSEVLGSDSKSAIIRLMIEKEVRAVFYGRIEGVQTHYAERFNVDWPDDDIPGIVVASRMRNCLMHNGCLVDERLAEVCERQLGTMIRLDPSEVHRFGIRARSFARAIWQDVNNIHLQEAG